MSNTKFQFTPLREGRRCTQKFHQKRSWYFNSRPSARGDDGRSLGDGFGVCISIHAPPRGATSLKHTTTSRALFQFTPLREGRQLGIPTVPCIRLISIHAPPRGATRRASRKRKKRTLFQFTPLREGRRRGSKNISRQPYFNSRPSARGDAPRRGVRSAVENFNSRPSARGDALRVSLRTYPVISIHAPPRGATRMQA